MDFQLMLDRSQDYLEQAAKLKAQSLSFHIEAAPFPLRLFRRIKEFGMCAGVVYSPSTDIHGFQYIITRLILPWDKHESLG